MSDDLEQRHSEVMQKYEDLQRQVALTELQKTLTETSSELAGLPERIKGLRERGYAFANYLEGKADLLRTQWDELKTTAQQTMQREKDQLAADLEELEKTYRALGTSQGAIAERQVDYLEPNIERVKKTLAVAEEEVRASFGEVPHNTQQTIQQIKTIEGYVDIAASATFPLGVGESIFMAVQAEWRESGKGGDQDPDGYFYITDQRVLMEQKEKVGKNFLGMGGKEKHELLWEAPLGSVEQVEHENKGMLGGIDLIHLTFGAGAPLGKTTLEIKGGLAAEWFAAQLQRAASGGLEAERGLAVDKTVIEAVVNAPTSCAVCGAKFEQRLLKGLNEIRCDYCGSITRLSI